MARQNMGVGALMMGSAEDIQRSRHLRMQLAFTPLLYFLAVCPLSAAISFCSVVAMTSLTSSDI